MDDSYMTASKAVDIKEVLRVASKFMDWSRFKLKSSKSEALVYDIGKVVERSVEGNGGVGEFFKLTLSGEVISSVSEKPIRFLGRWIRAKATDKEVIEQAWEWDNLNHFLEKLCKSSSTGLKKCWGYPPLVFPKTKWVVLIYDVPSSEVLRQRYWLWRVKELGRIFRKRG